MYQFKAKDLEINSYPLCLDNMLKDFTIDITKNRFKRKCTTFFC